MSKYVCLEGIEEGNRFYASYNEGEDPTRLASGKEAYRVLGYADTEDEAQKALGFGISKVADRVHLADYLFRTGRGYFDRTSCAEMAVLLLP